MVWDYDNFADAYDHLETFYETAWSWWHWIDTYIAASNTKAGEGDWNQAIRYSNTATYWLETCCAAVFDFYVGLESRSHFLASIWFASTIPSAGDITMDMILSAMVSADPDQVNYFVGLVDAYRQSVWNKPFNQEFFAALARGFELWP